MSFLSIFHFEKEKKVGKEKGFPWLFNLLVVSADWNTSMGFIFLMQPNAIYQHHWTPNIQAPGNLGWESSEMIGLNVLTSLHLFPHLRDTQVLIDQL